jgi:hypothetical protein
VADGYLDTVSPAGQKLLFFGRGDGYQKNIRFGLSDIVGDGLFFVCRK